MIHHYLIMYPRRLLVKEHIKMVRDLSDSPILEAQFRPDFAAGQVTFPGCSWVINPDVLNFKGRANLFSATLDLTINQRTINNIHNHHYALAAELTTNLDTATLAD
jgi:hypothetical protein